MVRRSLTGQLPEKSTDIQGIQELLQCLGSPASIASLESVAAGCKTKFHHARDNLRGKCKIIVVTGHGEGNKSTRLRKEADRGRPMANQPAG